MRVELKLAFLELHSLFAMHFLQCMWRAKISGLRFKGQKQIRSLEPQPSTSFTLEIVPYCNIACASSLGEGPPKHHTLFSSLIRWKPRSGWLWRIHPIRRHPRPRRREDAWRPSQTLFAIPEPRILHQQLKDHKDLPIGPSTPGII